MHISLRRLAASCVSAAVAALTHGTPAAAASPLAAMPIGKSITYHVTAEADKPPAQGGNSSTDAYVQVKRTNASAFAVSLNGAPSGQITLNADGSLNVPSQLKKPLAPFGEVAMLMRSAPKPLAQGANWSASLPVPLSGQTDTIAVAVGVTQFGKNGATVVANGQNETEVRPALRAHPTDVAFTATMRFGAAHLLTYATSNLSVSVKLGAFRSKHLSDDWTLSLVGP